MSALSMMSLTLTGWWRIWNSCHTCRPCSWCPLHWLADDVFNTFATHLGLVHDVPDTDWLVTYLTLLPHMSTSFMMSLTLIGWWRIWHFWLTYRPCSWCPWRKQPGKKWQHSRSCCRDFQTSIFSRQDQKSIGKKEAVCLYLIPFPSIGPVVLLRFGISGC